MTKDGVESYLRASLGPLWLATRPKSRLLLLGVLALVLAPTGRSRGVASMLLSSLTLVLLPILAAAARPKCLPSGDERAINSALRNGASDEIHLGQQGRGVRSTKVLRRSKRCHFIDLT
jgi:hypothetical protein